MLVRGLSQRPVVRGAAPPRLVSLILHVGTMPLPSLTLLAASGLAWCGSDVQLCLDSRWRRRAVGLRVVAGGLPLLLCRSPGLNW